MKKYSFIVFIFSLFLIISCAGDETCTQTKYVKLTVNFYHPNPLDTILSNRIVTLSIDSLTVQGLKKDSTGKYTSVDSILYNNQKNVSTINLPLNNFSTSSIFKIKFNAVTDTMTISHSNLNDYLSLECGCIITHTIDSVSMTNHYIDSVRIKIHDVNTINAENIRLYNKFK